MSASYFLSPHVHVCVAGKQVVLLDLERDKYLSMASASPIGRWVRGWPAPPADSAAGPENSAAAGNFTATGDFVGTGDFGAAGDAIGAGDSIGAGDAIAAGDSIGTGDAIGAGDSIGTRDAIAARDSIGTQADAAALQRDSTAPSGGSAAPKDDSAGPSESAAENRLLAKMIEQGLLVKDASVGKEASPVVTELPESAMVEYDLNSRPSTTLEHLWRVCTAYTSAKWALRRRPIKEVVEVVRLRKKQGSSSDRLDAETVRPLVTAFVYLRPLFFTSKDACLLDSLTLVNFLAGYGVFPQWVFGVKTDPFYAHCWVQQGGFVFNDTPDYIRGFSPILVV